MFWLAWKVIKKWELPVTITHDRVAHTGVSEGPLQWHMHNCDTVQFPAQGSVSGLNDKSLHLSTALVLSFI